MDNPLTPNKIQRLMYLAEDKSFNVSRRILMNDDFKRTGSPHAPPSSNKSTTTHYESSSGILDLDRVEGFGESSIGNLSLSKSTAFNPGEMTGRSTGTDEIKTNITLPINQIFDGPRHSICLEDITNKMNKQTLEVDDIMRHSIASNYSFHSKRDLTADEESFMRREAVLPVHPNTHKNIQDSIINTSNQSMGTYFKNRCPEFGKILGKTDSPDRSMAPSISEVSIISDIPGKETNQPYKLDNTLDRVPVRQPKAVNESQTCFTNVKDKPIYPKSTNTAQDQAAKNKVEFKIPNIQSSTSHKSVVGGYSKPTDILLKNLHTSFKMLTDDTEGTEADSLSLSRIADYLGNQSNVSITDMLKYNNQKKHMDHKNVNLSQFNYHTKKIDNDVQVTYLKDTTKTETASSSSTVNTVISTDKIKLNEETSKEVPAVVITAHSLGNTVIDTEIAQPEFRSRSKSPMSRSKSPTSSQLTLSTVQENHNSFKSSNSPQHTSRGEVNTTHIPSPNMQYRELNVSVDWKDVLQHKYMKNEGLVEVKWAKIETTPVNGFVGVSCTVTIIITTLSESWLTAKLKFDDLPMECKELNIELPRFPILLSPGKSEQLTLHLTSYTEMNSMLPFTLFLKDASLNDDIIQKGCLETTFKMPVIQALSNEGANKVMFPAIPEKTNYTKSFILISDCPADVQLELSIVEGDSLFNIKSVQEVKKSDVNKVLLEHQASVDDVRDKSKSKGMSKQLCRLSGGNAIKVTLTFFAPKLGDLNLENKTTSFNGSLNVNLIGVNALVRKVDLCGVVGTVKLIPNVPTNRRLQLNKDPKTVTLENKGTLPGVWSVKYHPGHISDMNKSNVPFRVSPNRFEIKPGCCIDVAMWYTGPEDSTYEISLAFEETTTGHKTVLEVAGGNEKPKVFPIKTNYANISWVRSGRKELSLKNSTDKKINIECHIIGEGFSIDLPRKEPRRFSVTFGPHECRPLPIVFAPTSHLPSKATLHLAFDRSSEYSRKINLFGCACVQGINWMGLVTLGAMAFVRGTGRAPLELKLFNRALAPTFVAATVNFNLQYISVAATSKLMGARKVVPARSHHTITLHVDWTKVERRARDVAGSSATALATVKIITGHDFTRRRILKVLQQECNGDPQWSLLPEHLKPLAGQFDGEDPAMDRYLNDFNETKASLNDLIGGLEELTAQIDLPQDFGDENTIIISDDTVIEHHTLCD